MNGEDTGRWLGLRRLGFRFLLVYFVLYVLPFPLSLIPGVSERGDLMRKIWDPLVLFTGEHLLGLGEITVRPAGSGDTTWNYVQVLILFVLATVGGLLWTLLDRRGSAESRFATPFIIGCRYYMASVMLTYGLIKIFPAQFPFPTFDRLLMPLGEASPMGLAWRFMGYSSAYSFFTGAGEAIGGLLLLWRRTTALGAVIVIGVMSNVVMINFAFDVPVKLFSSHLLLMALALFSLDARRFVDVFILHRATAPRSFAPYFDSPRARRAVMVAKIVLVGSILVSTVTGARSGYLEWGKGRTPPPLHGIWEVETFVRDGETVPPLLTDPARWRYLVFDYPGAVSLHFVDGSRRGFELELDLDAGRMTLSAFGKEETEARLRVEEPSADRLTLAGDWGDAAISAELRRFDHQDLELVRRGFHWVNEVPYHR